MARLLFLPCGWPKCSAVPPPPRGTAAQSYLEREFSVANRYRTLLGNIVHIGRRNMEVETTGRSEVEGSKNSGMSGSMPSVDCAESVVILITILNLFKVQDTQRAQTLNVRVADQPPPPSPCLSCYAFGTFFSQQPLQWHCARTSCKRVKQGVEQYSTEMKWRIVAARR